MTESQEKPNSSETVEFVKKKCLLIDDHTEIVKGISHFFSNADNFTAVECHSVEEALEAIRVNSPEILFLDHSLSYGGSEGFEISTKVKELNPEIKIYSTTANSGIVREYSRRGIRHIEKSDLDKLSEVVSGK